MAKKSETHLSRRERQIMDIVYKRGQASVAEVHKDMAERPSYSSVRALMGILEDKGHLTHQRVSHRYIYMPRRSHKQASKSAVKRVLETFFDGSAERAIAALIEASDRKPNTEELNRLAKLIEKARKAGG